MTQKRWRIGIIGCGWAGDQHARAFQALSTRAEMIVVVDNKRNAAENLAGEYGIPTVVTDYTDVLAMSDVDAVSLCLPHQIHAPVAIAAAKAGKHVLVEKPLATSLAEADAMIAAADRAGVKLMVAENVRYNQLYLELVQVIERGQIGQLSLIRISREHQMHDYLRQRPWFLSDPFAGIMVSGGIHDYELLRMLGGEIDHIYGLVGPKALPELQTDDNSVAAVGLASGVTALIVESFSLRTPTPGINGIIHGSLGSLWFAGDGYRLYTDPEDGHEQSIEQVAVSPGETFVAEAAHFLDCLDQDREPITSAREERKPLVAVIATYESFRRGERVYLAEVETAT